MSNARLNGHFGAALAAALLWACPATAADDAKPAPTVAKPAATGATTAPAAGTAAKVEATGAASSKEAAPAKDEHGKAAPAKAEDHGKTDGHAKAEDHGKGGHGDHAHHGAPLHPEGRIDPSEPRKDLAIFTLLTFCVTMLVLGKFAWPLIDKALEEREHGIAEHLAKAEKIEADAKGKLAEYDRKLFTVNDEIKAIIEEARRDGETVRQEALAKAEGEIRTLRERVLNEIETAKAQALKEVAERGADVAVDLAGRLVSAHLNRGDHERLISEALERIRTETTVN